MCSSCICLKQSLCIYIGKLLAMASSQTWSCNIFLLRAGVVASIWHAVSIVPTLIYCSSSSIIDCRQLLARTAASIAIKFYFTMLCGQLNLLFHCLFCRLWIFSLLVAVSVGLSFVLLCSALLLQFNSTCNVCFAFSTAKFISTKAFGFKLNWWHMLLLLQLWKMRERLFAKQHNRL